jgi:hypothetical protein
MKTLLTVLFINMFICAKDESGYLCYDAQTQMIDANGKGTLRIFDICGRLIYATNLQDTEGCIYEMQKHGKGIYIATIRDKHIKFVKQSD